MDTEKYIGRLLDNRYEILEVIGVGGMAVVYKARCHRLNRLVAIKILKDDLSQDMEFRRRFHAESQAVAMLSHPNIMSVYDVSTTEAADYIVMELIDGITLKQYMEKKGTLNWKETLHFAMQIAKGLEHAHSRGIVHRDIKPHNVMVLKNGSVKVTDFGIARVMSKSNTLTKEALGSVHYISPEQAKGGRVDNRSDIYSLGVVMYEMMTGRPPYDGESPVAVAIQHINGNRNVKSSFSQYGSAEKYCGYSRVCTSCFGRTVVSGSNTFTKAPLLDYKCRIAFFYYLKCKISVAAGNNFLIAFIFCTSQRNMHTAGMSLKTNHHRIRCFSCFREKQMTRNSCEFFGIESETTFNEVFLFLFPFQNKVMILCLYGMITEKLIKLRAYLFLPYIIICLRVIRQKHFTISDNVIMH